MSGSYALHPEAYMDLDEICGYIAQDNPDAADRVITEIFNAIRALVRFPDKGADARTSPRGPFASFGCVNI